MEKNIYKIIKICYNNDIFFYWSDNMYKIIDSNYCDDKFVMATKEYFPNRFIVSLDGIVYLKIGDKELIRDDNNSENNFRFDTSGIDRHEVPIIYEYNKQYLDFVENHIGTGAKQNYFFKGTNRALHVEDYLHIDERYTYSGNESYEVSRGKIESIFNKDNYDAMYVFAAGKLRYAYTKKDGLVLNNLVNGDNIIPTDEEIIKLELEDRLGDYNILKVMGHARKIENKDREPKTIDEITNFKLYGGFLRNFVHMLLTVKNGKFNLMYFRIEFLEKDWFKLTTYQIPVIEPTVDDIINITRKEDERVRKLEEEKRRQEQELEKQNTKKKKINWFKNI